MIVINFRLLGPIEASAVGRELSIGQPRQCGVLAALLVDAGRLVTWESLVDRVWGDDPPNGARHALYSHVARIRRMLAEAADDSPPRLVRRPGGYLVDIEPSCVDIHRFRCLSARADRLGCDDVARLGMLREALSLWRGEPLAGLSGAWAARFRDRWYQHRLDTTMAWAEAEVRLGDPRAVIAPLNDLVDRHDLVEPLAGLLMRALCVTGRGPEALECFTGIRRRLIEQLGTEPGADLHSIHQAILYGERDRPVVAVDPRSAPPARRAPAQLPREVPCFTGRVHDLAELDALLPTTSERPTAVVVATLTGPPGVGKTALAVHWAHRVTERLPDGQLYVNLRGFDPGRSPVRPSEAICGFLAALDVPAHRIPTDLDSMASLYRSQLAGRRVLVVLDNARDAEQVRPLLPGAPGSFVIVTSRDQLTSLIAAEGAQPSTVDGLTRAEARHLLELRLGAARTAADPSSVEDIITGCAGLPLALVIVAARAALHPGFSLRTLAGELRDTRQCLDALVGEDSSSDLRATFSWSYETLSTEAARLFRLVGSHPGPALDVAAVASVAGVAQPRARRLLTELTRAHLVTESDPGQYAVRHLLGGYAAELARAVDSETDRCAAGLRLLDHRLGRASRVDTSSAP